MSLFLVVLALLLVGAVALLTLGRGPGRSRERVTAALLPADGGPETLAVPVANQPPVLLDTGTSGERLAEQIDGIRFSLGLRGYRMEQVDEVLDVLRDALTDRDARIAELVQQLEDERLAPERHTATERITRRPVTKRPVTEP